MSVSARLLVFVLAMLVGGCYHATIETGLSSSSETIEQSWASGWIYGLIPPSTISTQAKCKNGVARVETQLSFLNQVVGFITFGIYTPMEIKVTCAAGSSSWNDVEGPEIILDSSATPDEITQAFMKAADIAVQEGRPVLIAF